jgi:hypothetical protein
MARIRQPGRPRHFRRVLAFTDVVVARDKAHRQTGRSVQTPGRDQIGFLRRAIK